ncbi:MAG: undecaprenyl-diphosphate phosphatase [Clostridia bacterium]|nr:undecaprenyl-diphosphate phosphatase [Clostridia bacterium]
MTVLQAIFLGIIQGLTEFLPISSSAHLNIMPWLFNWQEIPESFDVALHFGTLLAICIYFFKDWIDLIIGGYKKAIKKEDSTDGRIFWYIAISTIPTGILSIILEKFSDKYLPGMAPIAVALIVMGILLYIIDKKSSSEVGYDKITFKQGFLIGLSQAIAAAFPGVSRSGITMTVSRLFKIDRESAAKYSFLLSTPVVLAAVLINIGNFVIDIPFILGLLASFISGLLVIKFLMEYLKKKSFKVFAIYRLILGLIILAILIIK